MSRNLTLASISVLILCLLGSTPALAQQRGVTIQLPVVRQYQNTSSYLIPDGGTIGAGGISRSASGTTFRGTPGLGRPFGNRFGGAQTSRSQSSVTANIISNREVSEAILAGASQARPTQVPFYKEVWARQRAARFNQQK